MQMLRTSSSAFSNSVRYFSKTYGKAETLLLMRRPERGQGRTPPHCGRFQIFRALSISHDRGHVERVSRGDEESVWYQHPRSERSEPRM